jgi:signal transduction histidine kinase
MDVAKVDSIAKEMVEIPDIGGVRIVDPATSHLFTIALDTPGGAIIGTDDQTQNFWFALLRRAAVHHRFDIVYRHATGHTIVGRAEMVASWDRVITRTRAQTTLIVVISLFKEAVLWAIFLLVSRRILVRPLSMLIATLHAVAPDKPAHISLPASAEPIIAGTELGVVRDSVNTLMDQIEAYQGQLLALNNDLEHKVAERTRALEMANKNLREQSQRLRESNIELEQFATVASHDLRQPLRMVSSYLSLLERRYAAVLDDDGRTFLDFARDGANRMDRLIQDMLNLSRIGRTAAPFVPTALSEIVGEALASLTFELEDAGITIQTPSDLPVIYGDADELVRLISNLLGNAVKYRATDRTPVISLGWRPDDSGQVLCWVQDNGIGIASDDFDRIFQIFQRLHAPDSYGGTGIGLAICKKIVEHHGGRIWVESSPGNGSTFYFTLPRSDRAAAATAP